MKTLVVFAALAAFAAAAPALSETDSKLHDLIGAILNHLNRPPVSVGPAIVDEDIPISVGPAIIDEENPIASGPLIIDEDYIINPSADDEEIPDIHTLPAFPVEDQPISIDIPGGPTINIIVNVNSAHQFEEIEPTPINFVDDLEAETSDDIEPTPVQIVDDFSPDPDVFY